MMSQETAEGKSLLSRLREGDRCAFEQIYHQHKRTMAAIMLKMVKDPALVDDLLQELFVKLWEYRTHINPDAPLGGYIYRIAQNLVHDFFRKLSRDKKMQSTVMEQLSQYQQGGGEDKVQHEETDELIHAAIRLLPAKRRQVYVLRKFESKTYEEISLMLNINPSTINDHIYKANQFVRKYLATKIVYLLVIGSSVGL